MTMFDGELPAVTDTLSKTDSLRRFGSELVTTRPASASGGIDNMTLPTWVQFVPFADTDPVMVVPDRSSFTHVGGACTAVSRNVVSASVLGRIMNSRSLVGRRSRITCADPGFVDCRIITPALANVFVFCILRMRATIWPSP